MVERNTDAAKKWAINNPPPNHTIATQNKECLENKTRAMRSNVLPDFNAKKCRGRTRHGKTHFYTSQKKNRNPKNKEFVWNQQSKIAECKPNDEWANAFPVGFNPQKCPGLIKTGDDKRNYISAPILPYGDRYGWIPTDIYHDESKRKPKNPLIRSATASEATRMIKATEDSYPTGIPRTKEAYVAMMTAGRKPTPAKKSQDVTPNSAPRPIESSNSGMYGTGDVLNNTRLRVPREHGDTPASIDVRRDLFPSGEVPENLEENFSSGQPSFGGTSPIFANSSNPSPREEASKTPTPQNTEFSPLFSNSSNPTSKQNFSPEQPSFGGTSPNFANSSNPSPQEEASKTPHDVSRTASVGAVGELLRFDKPRGQRAASEPSVGAEQFTSGNSSTMSYTPKNVFVDPYTGAVGLTSLLWATLPRSEWSAFYEIRRGKDKRLIKGSRILSLVDALSAIDDIKSLEQGQGDFQNVEQFKEDLVEHVAQYYLFPTGDLLNEKDRESRDMLMKWREEHGNESPTRSPRIEFTPGHENSDLDYQEGSAPESSVGAGSGNSTPESSVDAGNFYSGSEGESDKDISDDDETPQVRYGSLLNRPPPLRRWHDRPTHTLMMVFVEPGTGEVGITSLLVETLSNDEFRAFDKIRTRFETRPTPVLGVRVLSLVDALSTVDEYILLGWNSQNIECLKEDLIEHVAQSYSFPTGDLEKKDSESRDILVKWQREHGNESPTRSPRIEFTPGHESSDLDSQEGSAPESSVGAGSGNSTPESSVDAENFSSGSLSPDHRTASEGDDGETPQVRYRSLFNRPPPRRRSHDHPTHTLRSVFVEPGTGEVGIASLLVKTLSNDEFRTFTKIRTRFERRITPVLGVRVISLVDALSTVDEYKLLKWNSQDIEYLKEDLIKHVAQSYSFPTGVLLNEKDSESRDILMRWRQKHSKESHQGHLSPAGRVGTLGDLRARVRSRNPLSQGLDNFSSGFDNACFSG
ncbi:unknown [Feldmannia species virus]|uniref:Uncharacterized protein n=1 Tax=Feldmannia species virus TaxID=39420 RepID=B5LWI0_9PHYC|nr:hypothetical protein FeldSpV_gp091 [Feldmannia species virus]ACH46843.1 unknown [Feldmannia species virus]